jgi:sec-independent protein translocase protein TatA
LGKDHPIGITNCPERASYDGESAKKRKVVMPNLRAPEILLILLVVLLLFGAKRLPDLAKSVGKSLKILKTEVRDINDDAPAATPPVATPPAAAPPVAAPYTPPTTAPPTQFPTTQVPTNADTSDRKQV